ncbi:hypothetical protein KKC60_03760 [Patescibacteria group bacterium]|nr:hypothetical protein [Patescibacteria group bacterium]
MKKRILIVLPLLLFGLMVAGCEKDIAEENNLNEVRNKELSDLVEYKNKQWGFKILYPEGWEYE